MSQSQNPVDIGNLFAGAQAAGIVGAAGQSVLTGSLGPVVIAGAAGKDAEDITASDVTLVTLLVDASSSIHGYGLEASVREGQNHLVDALSACRERDSMLLSLWTFNDDIRVVHSYVGVDDAAKLDAKTYAGVGGTRLYDAWLDALAANVAYAQRLRDSGTPCKSVVVVVTDGEDSCSRRRYAECARLSKELVASELFTLAFVGVGNGAAFTKVAKNMGVPDGNVLVQKQTTPSAIRALFRLVSQSTIRASQAMVGPGPAGGFFTP